MSMAITSCELVQQTKLYKYELRAWWFTPQSSWISSVCTSKWKCKPLWSRRTYRKLWRTCRFPRGVHPGSWAAESTRSSRSCLSSSCSRTRRSKSFRSGETYTPICWSSSLPGSTIAAPSWSSQTWSPCSCHCSPSSEGSSTICRTRYSLPAYPPVSASSAYLVYHTCHMSAPCIFISDCNDSYSCDERVAGDFYVFDMVTPGCCRLNNEWF